MGKLNEIQEQMTQSYGNNAFTTTIKDDTVEFDSLRDKFTFKDEVEVPSLKVGGEPVGPAEPQVQADWNQNDNTKADYIKNRICYEEITTSTLFNDTFLYTDHQMNISAGMVELTTPFAFEEGKSYIVTKDGVGYEMVAQIVDDTPSLVYGNFAELENGSWMMAVVEGDNFYVSECAETELSSTVLKIEGDSETVHQLDDKYISSNIARTADIPVVPTVAENILDGSAAGSVRSKNSKTTIGADSFSFGSNTQASGRYSVATGYYTTASADYSNAEGNQTKASGEDSHAEGMGSESGGMCSHAEGMYTIAKYKSQHVFGEFNVQDPNSGNIPFMRGNFIEIVGNGTNNNSRSNARTLDWSGNEVLAGTLSTTGVSTKKMTIAGIDPADCFMHSEIIDASSDVSFSRTIASTSSSKTDGYVEILYKVSSGVTCSAYINSTDVSLTADGDWHKLERGCNPADGVEIHINNPSPVTDATMEVISKVYYI